MYCPKCGLNNAGSIRICKKCRENLQDIKSHIKNEKCLYFFHFISGWLFLITVMLSMYYGYGIFFQNYYFTFLLIITVFSSIFFFLFLFKSESIKDFNFNCPKSKINYVNGCKCPKCLHSGHNKNYCIECGYNLNEVLCYFETHKSDIELNTKYIKVFRKRRDGYGDVRASKLPKTYLIDGIRNFQMCTCKAYFWRGYCLKFHYHDGKSKKNHSVELTIPPEYEDAIRSIMPEMNSSIRSAIANKIIITRKGVI